MSTARVPLWSGTIPGPPAQVKGPEADLSKPGEGMTGGRTVIRLGNVATPELEVFLPPAGKATGTGVVICPGGGFSILAWDLEGTEVAAWLNGIGVAAFVLKYRVPTGSDGRTNWLGPTIDTQRALRHVRAEATAWGVQPDRLGVLGFSAGGKTAGMAALHNGKPLYESTDTIDRLPCRADFAALIYPAYFCDPQNQLLPELAPLLNGELPPFFFAHAADDPVTCQSSLQLCAALQRARVPAELHLYESGGHGYGLRPQKGKLIPTAWPQRCEEWLRQRGLLKKGA